MYFTLAISAATRERCAALVSAAGSTDPRVMPIPGPPAVVWQDGPTAVLCWPGPDGTAARSHAGTIWADDDGLHARTGVTRVDPVYLTEVPGAVLVSDRASWAAAVAGRLAEPDPVMAAAFLSLGYPVGAATPFRGVRALGAQRQLTIAAGRPIAVAAQPDVTGADVTGADGTGADGSYGAVAAALVDAVRPLGERGVPVELSLTGGKDSRLIAAALTAAQVPFRARTHGFASHPDVIVAAMIASELGIEHVVTEPRPAAPERAPDEADVLARLRSAVLVSDGMLSAFENVGRPDPPVTTEPVQTGGHGGELLRGGYAPAAWSTRWPARTWSEARGTELFRRMVTRRLGLLRPAAAGAYLASVAPFAASLPRGALRTLDDFYLVNRAGRWSAAARQAYLLREPLVQPFFDDQVVRAARAVPLPDRITDRLHRGVLAALCPELLDLPLADSGWKSGPRTPPVRATANDGAAGAAGAAAPAGAAGAADAAADWRRAYGDRMARLLRDYALDLGAAGGMFEIVRRSAAERALAPPQPDSHAAWALATLAALLSGDWLNARGGTEVSPARSASRPARRTPLPPRA
ncbi:MAG: asparagine synthase-related protein [Streptosporangiaceae bacterium]